MLLVGAWKGGLSDEAVEEMANSNLHVMRFLGLSLEDEVSDYSVLSRFRTRLTATHACSCGYLGHPSGKCHCTPDQVARYRGRISGPLLDRIDIQIEVPAVPQGELMRQKITGEKSSIIRQRVEKSHQLQLNRQGKTKAA